MTVDALVVCAPGLEPVLDGELAGLGIRRRRLAKGGVSVRVTTRELYAINVWARTASRVLVRMGRFRATTFRDLEREIAALDWTPWLPEDSRVKLRVSSGSSRLHHTGAIAERIENVLQTRAGAGVHGEGGAGGVSTDDDVQTFVVRVRHDVVTVSVDASGDNLHQRGWRLATAKAPLRETLAAAMVLASGWTGDRPFLDPLCGSGTIAIEAALLAQGRAPGAHRTFAFQRWPAFEPGTWASVRAGVQRAESGAAERTVPPIAAADRDAGAVRATTENAERAGVAGVVQIEQASLAESIDRHVSASAVVDEPPGLVLTNPPYGGRVGGPDLRDLYATLGRAAAWDVGVLVADRALAGHTKLTLEERFRTSNGGIPVMFLRHAARPARR